MTTARNRIPFTFLATENMARYSMNSKGRTFIHGKSIEEDLRASIIDSIIAEGGDPGSGYFEEGTRKLLIGTESRVHSFRNYGERFATPGNI